MDFTGVTAITIPEGNAIKITRQSDGAVLWEKVMSRIPKEYQEVEYIRAANNIGAFIDLGFAFDTRARILLTQIINSISSTAYVFGAAENSGVSRCMLSSPYGGGSTLYGSTGHSHVGVTTTCITGVNEFEMFFEKGNLQLKNLTYGSSQKLSYQVEYTMENNLYLFAQNYNGSARYGNERTVKAFQYYDKTGALTCDLVPCYRKSDGVIGMYDTVRKIFLINTNISAGSFIKGPLILGDEYVNVILSSTESDGKTIYNGGKGYKDGYRVRSGGAEAELADATITGYIPYVKGDKLYIYPPFSGGNTDNTVNFYDSAFNCLGQVTDVGSCYGFCNSTFKTKVINGVSVLDLSAVTVSGVENVAFVRIGNNIKSILSGAHMFIIKNKELALT